MGELELCQRCSRKKETFAVLQQDAGEIGGRENNLYLVSPKTSRPPGTAWGRGWLLESVCE